MTDARMFQRCGNCKYHVWEELDNHSVCLASKSVFYNKVIWMDEVCEEWAKKPCYGFMKE